MFSYLVDVVIFLTPWYLFMVLRGKSAFCWRDRSANDVDPNRSPSPLPPLRCFVFFVASVHVFGQGWFFTCARANVNQQCAFSSFKEKEPYGAGGALQHSVGPGGSVAPGKEDGQGPAGGGKEEEKADGQGPGAGVGEKDEKGGEQGPGCGARNDGLRGGESGGGGNEGQFVFDGGGTYAGDGSQYDECHRKQGRAEPAARFRPTEETLRKLPGRADLGTVSVAKMGELAFKFFILMFTPAAILLLVDKVRMSTVAYGWRSFWRGGGGG